jgi:hypothetical protein
MMKLLGSEWQMEDVQDNEIAKIDDDFLSCANTGMFVSQIQCLSLLKVALSGLVDGALSQQLADETLRIAP